MNRLSRDKASPLAVAGTDRVRRVLVDAGADVTGRNAQGDTVLHQLAKSGDLELARIVIAKGADVR